MFYPVTNALLILKFISLTNIVTNYKMAETNICASIQMTFLHGAITHQISDTRLQHARHIRIFSRADKTTQASSPEAGSQAEAEEASGDGQLNDRLIDSPNHADVHFVDHLSI